MKTYHYSLGVFLAALLFGSEIAIAADPASILPRSPNSFQVTLKQDEPVYVTDRQFVRGEWSFRVNQAGSDLKYQGSSLIRGRDIIVNRVKRTKGNGRLIYTWQTGPATFYVVNWQPTDPTFARLKIIKSGNTLVNELLQEEQP
jgi:hypothetical protein